MTRRAIVTVVTRNYLAYARPLMRQCARHEPHTDRFVVVADRLPDGYGADVDAHVLHGDELGIERWPRYAFQYTPFELACALKPHAIGRLMDRLGYEAVLYLDSDMAVYGPLTPAWEALEAHGVVLTPHVARPLPDDGLRPHESMFLPTGAYNAGFLGVRNDADGRAFTTWWRSMLARHCILDLPAGLFVDQKWLNMVPGLFSGVAVLRRFGVNAGHWTLSQAVFEHRPTTGVSASNVTVDGDPLLLFHFSGMTPHAPADYLGHQTRTRLDRIPCLAALVERFQHDIMSAGFAECVAWGCETERLLDGTPVKPAWRRAIRREEPAFSDVDDPFDTTARPDLVRRYRRLEPRPRGLRRLFGRHPASLPQAVRPPIEQPWPPDVSESDRRLLARAARFTMTSLERQVALLEAVRYVIRRGVPGDFVECGVWRGGSSMIVAMALEQMGVRDRDLHLFDTFEGMTPPTDADRSLDGVSALSQLNAASKADAESVWCRAGLDDVRDAMASTGYPMERIHLVKGSVERTLPGAAPDAIALLRLDTDWYESTRHEMQHLFPRLSSAGVLLVDDYGHWQGVRRAVDEYFAEQGGCHLMHRIDYTGRMLVKA